MVNLCRCGTIREDGREIASTTYKLRGPSYMWDTCSTKGSPAYPLLKYKSTKLSLWAHCCLRLPWVTAQQHWGLEELHVELLCGNFESEIELHTEPAAFVALLNACAKTKDLCTGARLHAQLLRRGLLEKSSFVGVALIDMYGKGGALVKAKEMLDGIAARDVVSWNALIAGYAQHGEGEQALSCFEEMKEEGIIPDVVTFTCVLKACGSIGAARKGEEIHDEVARQGLLGKDIVMSSALVDMYVKCGALAKAKEVLEEIPTRDVFTWTALIAGYAQNGQAKEALVCFERMQHEGVLPNAVTFTCALKACSSIGAADKGGQIHNEIVRLGLLKNNNVLGTALVDMYAKCGALAQAQRVLEDFTIRNVVSWNALIAGYAQQGQGHEALNCFEQMQREGFTSSATTFACVLKACGTVGAAEKGREIHDEIARQGLLEGNIVLGNALVDMYAKLGALAKAEQVLDKLPASDVVSWSAIIAGYVQHGKGKEALDCFLRMHCKGLFPNVVTFTSILKACRILQRVDKGEQIHDELTRQGLLGSDIALGVALVDMYARCGAFLKAQQVLYDLPAQDAVFWNALMAGYVEHGQGEDAFDCFKQVQGKGLSPNAVTFSNVLKVLAA